MKKMTLIKIIFLSLFVFSNLAYAGSAGDWTEDFDDSDTSDTFDYDTGIMGSGTYTRTFVDRPGNGKALFVNSNAPEVIPIWFGLNNNFGVRWKFDLWIGPKTGTPRHTADDLKFIHRGTDPLNVFKLKEVNDTPNLRKTNLATGEEMPVAPTDMTFPSLHFSIFDSAEWNLNISNTNLNPYREQWITVEIEIVCGNPSSSKIWIDGNLDFYRVNNGTMFNECYTSQLHFVNYNLSSGGDVYLGIDNFYKYDTVKPTVPNAPELK